MLSDATRLFDEPDAFLEALPGYQRDLLEQLGVRQDPEAAASAWLSAAGAPNTFQLGGSNQTADTSFSSRLKAEIRLFLCDEEAYAEDRDKIVRQGEITHVALVWGIAVALEPAMGSSSVFLAVPTAALLVVVSRIGLQAWCSAEIE